MCGLFGVASKGFICKEKALNALDKQIHRGPDQVDFWQSSGVFLGHRRLSILDLSESGRQPMHDLGVTISVNGEIYNFKELKLELEQKYTFKSASDSEVVLYGYLEWGLDELLERIDGMYSFVIYDENNDQIHLVRDRVGIKPLYYSDFGGEITWGSELKSITEYYGKSCLVRDKTAIYDFLTYLYIPAPKTLYKNVYKLEPGSYLTYDLKIEKYTITKYWELLCDVIKIDKDTANEKVKSLIDDAVKQQLISDVPVGFFLSGGVDSSAVVASAATSTSSIHTYSIGFDDEKHSETAYAKIVSNLFKTKHMEQILTQDSAAELVDKMPEWYDEPFADTSALPTYLVSKFAKTDSTVVLTGDGGDEVFGGYHWYSKFNKFRGVNTSPYLNVLSPTFSFLKRSPFSLFNRVIERLQRQFIYTDMELYTKLLGGLISEEKKSYAKELKIPENYNDYWHFEKHYKKELPILTRLQYLDFKTYLPDDILTKVDRASMAVSLECRVPLLDKKVVEFAFSLPEEIRYSNGELKGVLKDAYVGVLPHEILFRKKKGFSIPIASWRKELFDGYNTKQEALLNKFTNGTEQ